MCYSYRVTVSGKYQRNNLISDHQQWPLERMDTTEQAMTSRKPGARRVARGRQITTTAIQVVTPPTAFDHFDSIIDD